MKRILGLDLGTNSIGWAVVVAEVDDEGNLQLVKIDAAGSRIIPMDAAILGDFDRGNSISQTAERTRLRGMRHLLERCLLRRERLHRVLDILGFLPLHYSQALNRYGQIKEGEEPKLAWRKNETGKYEFLFIDSFNEMLEDFRLTHPELVGKKVPYDWTIYYLRKKALTQKIAKEELAWILLNFNQKRGYYQLSEVEIEKDNNFTIESLKVVDVVKGEKDKKGNKYWFEVSLENGWIYKAAFYNDIYSWKSEAKDFIVKKTTLENGEQKISLSILPSIDEIERVTEKEKNKLYDKIRIKTEKTILDTGKTVGTYIYDSILQNPNQKVRGKLVRTIERKFYKDELIQILNKQKEFHSELQDKDLYQACIEELYTSNEVYRQNIANRDFTYLFVEDILFYQRPLKIKKSLIANCSYEEHIVKDKETGKEKKYGLKCIAKSHPLYQEFRLWKFISDLRIYKKELANDVDVTRDFLKTEEDYVALFDWLNDKKTIDQKNLLKYPSFGLKKNVGNYRWNYVEDKLYPCNETRAQLLSYLSKASISPDFLNKELEERMWHLLYSVDDKQELIKALRKFADKYSLNDCFVDVFQKFPPFKKEYGAYSAKAIKKLLPLMRMGKYWSESNIDELTRGRIDKIISGEYDESIKNRVREKAMNLTDVSSFRGLSPWLACYVVYNRHSEAKEITRWKTHDDLQKYLKSFKQHSLRNPIVEQVITETLRTVRDIWEKYEKIDEIHVELGRNMKQTAEQRRKDTEKITNNENTNLRIKALLMEFANPEFEIENVRPYSPSQQDILRIYEEGVLDREDVYEKDNSSDYKYRDEKEKNEIEDILKKFKESDVKKRPTRSEVLRYKLWLEQKYCSPYTGEPIPLAKLFTSAYEIEHVIPQCRYIDDSFSNKVICESKVNNLKNNLLGFEFIKKHRGEKIELSFDKVVTIFTEGEYEQFVKDHYGRNRTKMRKLLMESIPEDFIARQLNDSRYISKVIKGLLSNIVREESEEEAISKNVVVCTGGVTDRLKKDWGINDVWNKIILPRFLRLNEMTGTNQFATRTTNGHEVPSMPLELQKGFSKKRIDHRHHAMDAIIIACANRNIVNYLNNESASSKSKISRYDLQVLLCDKVKTDDKGNYKWMIKKPWNTFTQDVYQVLNNIVVSFKQNLRVINKATNMYVRFEDGKKKLVKQVRSNWAIRKSMHIDTVYGEVNLRKIKSIKLNEAIKKPSRIVEKEFKEKLLSLLKQGYDEERIKKYFEEHHEVWQDIDLAKIKVYYFTKETKDRFFATRKSLIEILGDVNDSEKTVSIIKNKITDTGIQTILLHHLEEKGNDPNIAYSLDGIDEMNRNIVRLNKGKFHHPIYKVRKYEKGDKFAVGQKGNKLFKFVEADKGSNLYFAIYEKEIIDEQTGHKSKKRSYATIPLNIVIDRLKQGLTPAPTNEDGDEPKYVLSPNDLVYVPTQEEMGKSLNITTLDKKRIYKFVSCTGNEAHFIPVFIANPIIQTVELGSNNKAQKSWTNEMIKEICIPIKVDRLGNIHFVD